MIIHGYDRCKLWLRVKRLSTRGIPRDPARRRRMFNRIRQCQEDTLAQHHQPNNSNGNTWPIQHMRSDLTCFIAGQAADHIYVLVVATGPNYVPVVGSTDGCITAALKAVVWSASQHLRATYASCVH